MGCLRVTVFRPDSPPRGVSEPTSQTNGQHPMKNPTVRGVVHLIEATKTFGQKGFRQRLVALEQFKGTFTNFIPVEFVKDDCDAVDDLSMGDEIEVTYRLSGRRWQRDAICEAKDFRALRGFRPNGCPGVGGPLTAQTTRSTPTTTLPKPATTTCRFELAFSGLPGGG